MIRLESVKKKYLLAHGGWRPNSLRDRIAAYGSQQSRGESEWITALDIEELQISDGERVGIIGPNGAGKSTLLKLISRITRPTQGRIYIKGLVSSLLEVNTGFHPELTGRENVHFKAALYGLRAKEIAQRFDSIVEFSGIGKFIDTPVKRYSSGMYVRLAFAVSAHLDPDILIVDEVLAVGDAAFQKQSIDRLLETSDEARTVVFVSHNLGLVQTICDRAILLDKGSVSADGTPSEVVSLYLAQNSSDGGEATSGRVELGAAAGIGSLDLVVDAIELAAIDNSERDLAFGFGTGDSLRVKVFVSAVRDVADAVVAIIFYDEFGYRIIDANTEVAGMRQDFKAGSQTCFEFSLYDVLLRPGTYRIGTWIGRRNIDVIHSIEGACSIEIRQSPLNSGHVYSFPGPYQPRFTISVRSEA